MSAEQVTPQTPVPEVISSADALVKAYDFAISSGAGNSDTTHPGNLVVLEDSRGNTKGFQVESTPDTGEATKTVIKRSGAYDSSGFGGRVRSYEVTQTDGVLDSDGSLHSIVDYKAEGVIGLDQNGRAVVRSTTYDQSKEISVNRRSNNNKLGEAQRGVVTKLTGSRAEKARTILETRAARSLGQEAVKRAQGKLDAYKPLGS